MESSFDLEDNQGESMYDLRMIERETFGKMYNALLENRANMMSAPLEDADKFEAQFRSVAVTMAQYLKHYMTDEDMVELAESTQKCADANRRSSSTWDADEVQDAIERLRHAAGLKLPQESNMDPESVGAEQL
jgi:folate-binding Fe-S cluster repair protein YgfZ